MSEEFEDISVDVNVDVSPVSSPVGGTEAPVVAFEESSTSATPDADQKVFDSNPNIGNAEDFNRQQVAEENGLSLGNGGADGRVVSEIGREAREAEKEEKRAQFLEAQEQSEQHAERRKNWLERDHDFGGQKMSGHDLDKLIQAYANNPQMQDKLKERMVKSGMSKDKADKAVQDFNEYMKLLKKESEGKELSPEEQRRKQELQKDKDVQQNAANLVTYQKAENVAKLTPDNEQRRLGNTESSISADQSSLSNASQSVTASGGASVYFGSYATPAVKAGVDPQAEFNMKAIGKMPDQLPKQVQMAMTVAEPASLGV